MKGMSNNKSIKNYMVTGAGRGIGFETALSLASSANAKIVCLSRNQAGLEKLVEKAKAQKLPGEIIPFRADILTLTNESLTAFLSVNTITAMDGLVNNAGLLINKPFGELSAADFGRIYETNVFAPVRLIQYLMPFLKRSEYAHIVNISSLGGFQGTAKFKGLSAYSSSKAALGCLSECLAVELAGENIAVNALALGAVDTEMLQQAFPGYKAPVPAAGMGIYVADFTMKGHKYYNGKILPVALAGQ
jgi:NAD(P)-dependent dehydrogenase (short-subunit alcohol dehydrogenase family)